MNTGAAQHPGTTRTGWKALCATAVAGGLLSACSTLEPAPAAVECAPLPDAREALAQAWQAYQPDQPLPFSIPVRRRLFVFQVLLISAGTYDEPPSDPAATFAQYAPQFVRDFGMSRNPRLADALTKLSQTLQQERGRPDTDLANNCGLILARRMLHDDAVNVSTDWVLQTVTWGFAPTFQESIQQLVRADAVACTSDPDVDRVPESVLACTMRQVGL